MQLIPEVKFALALLEKRKIRDKEGKFVVEGDHLVMEAGNRVEFVIYHKETPGVKWALGRKFPAYKVSQREFEKISQVVTPQGILAVVKKRQDPIESLFKAANPFVIFCDGIRDPGNLGTIIRGADAAGAAGVLLSSGCVELYNQKVIRSTQGSLFHLPILEVGPAETQIIKLKQKGLKVVAADAKGQAYWSAGLSGPLAIVVGNEGAGLSDEVLAICDEVVSIPMPGKAESLNAAMAANILMYEVLRQRWSKESKQ